jgi:hypothetical protein
MRDQAQSIERGADYLDAALSTESRANSCR